MLAGTLANLAPPTVAGSVSLVGGWTVKAQIGDRLQFLRWRLDMVPRVIALLEIGAGDDRPYGRGFDDGTEKLVIGGPDCVNVVGGATGGGG